MLTKGYHLLGSFLPQSVYDDILTLWKQTPLRSLFGLRGKNNNKTHHRFAAPGDNWCTLGTDLPLSLSLLKEKYTPMSSGVVKLSAQYRPVINIITSWEQSRRLVIGSSSSCRGNYHRPGGDPTGKIQAGRWRLPYTDRQVRRSLLAVGPTSLCCFGRWREMTLGM